MKKTYFFAILLCSICIQQTHIKAQSVVPLADSTFNNIGAKALDLLAYFEPLDMQLQADGKILVAGYGYTDVGANYDGILYRVNIDGTLDQSFGEEGFVVLDVDGGDDALFQMALLPDNKILVLMESAFRTILIRLLPNGSMDTSFGNEGFNFVPTAEYEFCSKVLLQADGKILILSDLASPTAYSIVTVRRCNPDGSLDETYGTNGTVKLVIDLSKNFFNPSGCVQPDGKLLVTGYFGSMAGSGYPVIRLNTDGSFDTSFSGDGIYIKILGSSLNNAQAETITVNSDGKIFVGGNSPTLTDVSMTVMSLNASGSTNGSFGSLGIARVPFTLFATARKIIIQPDGKVLLGGYTYQNPPTTTKFAFTRLNANGTPDLTFGTQQGRFVSSLEVDYDVQVIQDMELQADGRLVAAAWMQETINLNAPGNEASSYVLRYLTDITVKAEEPSLVFQQTVVSPNPIADETASLSYTLPYAATVSLSLYDASGRELANLMNPSQQSAGEQTLVFNLPPSIGSGNYYLLLSTGTAQKVVKIVKN